MKPLKVNLLAGEQISQPSWAHLRHVCCHQAWRARPDAPHLNGVGSGGCDVISRSAQLRVDAADAKSVQLGLAEAGGEGRCFFSWSLACPASKGKPPNKGKRKGVGTLGYQMGPSKRLHLRVFKGWAICSLEGQWRMSQGYGNGPEKR